MPRPELSCTTVTHCPWNENTGWRIVIAVVGSLTIMMVIGRVILFRLYESPRYLVSRGRYDEAVEVLHKLASLNGKTITITSQEFVNACELEKLMQEERKTIPWYITNFNRIKVLFTPALAWTTILVWGIYMFIALGNFMFFNFLPTFLSKAGTGESISIDQTYRDYMIASAVPVIGPIIAMYLADSFLGRKYTMALSTYAVAASLFLFTKFTTGMGQLIVTCVAGVFQNIVYATLFVYAPEVFPTEVRGTGVGIASALGRLTGLFAPILTGTLIDVGFYLPLYVSAGFFIVTATLMALVPIETRGRTVV